MPGSGGRPPHQEFWNTRKRLPYREKGRIFLLGARNNSVEQHCSIKQGYRFDNGWKVQIDTFNILNSRADMIDYQANVFGKQHFAINPWYGHHWHQRAGHLGTHL